MSVRYFKLANSLPSGLKSGDTVVLADDYDALTARCEADRDFFIHLRDQIESAAGGDAPRNALEELLYDIDEYLRSLADGGGQS